MKSRRIIAAELLSLLSTTRVTRAAVAPTDVIVIEVEQPLSNEEVRNIERVVNYVWPDNKAIVLESGMKLKITESKS